jgi:hypothetical protein
LQTEGRNELLDENSSEVAPEQATKRTAEVKADVHSEDQKIHGLRLKKLNELPKGAVELKIRKTIKQWLNYVSSSYTAQRKTGEHPQS